MTDHEGGKVVANVERTSRPTCRPPVCRRSPPSPRTLPATVVRVLLGVAIAAAPSAGCYQSESDEDVADVTDARDVRDGTDAWDNYGGGGGAGPEYGLPDYGLPDAWK